MNLDVSFEVAGEVDLLFPLIEGGKESVSFKLDKGPPVLKKIVMKPGRYKKPGVFREACHDQRPTTQTGPDLLRAL